MKRKFFSIIFSAAVLAAASMGITASAEENTESLVSDNADEAVSGALNESSAEDVPIDYFSDDYYDTNGNVTLIQEENIIYNSEEMQFIAVTTKDGHVFYVLINYSAENGEDNVYFLNNVKRQKGHRNIYALPCIKQGHFFCLQDLCRAACNRYEFLLDVFCHSCCFHLQ